MPENQKGKHKKNRRRVLLLAYACSPYRGSEEEVGWQRALAAGKYYDSWVLYGMKSNKREVKRYLKENGNIPGVHFYYVPETRIGRWMWKFPYGYYIAHYLWHRRAYRIAAKLHARLRFDIVHHVTWCGFREPGYLWKLDAPFIWGPVGGTQNYPWPFLFQAGLKGGLKEFVRNTLNIVQFRLQPRVRKAIRRTAVLLAANSTGKRHFERIYKVKPVHQLDVGTTAVRDLAMLNCTDHGPLRILWSGILEDHKALHLLIMALSKVPDTLEYELRILGKGPLEKRWRGLARQTGVDRYCKWMGWLVHEEAMAQYDWADVFIFTSLRDTCGAVVIEALSRGVPVICLDHQGAGDVVAEECGIKIPVTTPSRVIQRLREAIISIAKDRRKLDTLSEGAIERANRYLWSHKGQEMVELYRQVIDNSRVPHSKREHVA
ncbi:MAG: glycosyltransferase family 4 protein [Candidatus Hodarchaeota archaeon]